MKESDNYAHFKIDGNKNSYYLPNAREALRRGFFCLEDTRETFRVTGKKENVQPDCLEFEKFEGNLIFHGEIPVAKVVK